MPSGSLLVHWGAKVWHALDAHEIVVEEGGGKLLLHVPVQQVALFKGLGYVVLGANTDAYGNTYMQGPRRSQEQFVAEVKHALADPCDRRSDPQVTIF